MSHSTHTATVVISPDEILDLLVNGVESMVILDGATPATLRSVTQHSAKNAENIASHEFECILTLNTVYEHTAKVNLTESEDKTEFAGTVSYFIYQGDSMSE